MVKTEFGDWRGCVSVLDSTSPTCHYFSTFYQLLYTRIEETADRAMVRQDPMNGEIYFQIII